MKNSIVLFIVSILFCTEVYAQSVKSSKDTDIGDVFVTISLDKTCIKKLELYIDRKKYETPDKELNTICGYKSLSIKNYDGSDYIEISHNKRKTLLFLSEEGIWSYYFNIPYIKKVDPVEAN